MALQDVGCAMRHFRHRPMRPCREVIGARAKMPFPIHPHMLRHGCGYALANAGHDTRALQAYLGHKNIQHTVRYSELSPDRLLAFGWVAKPETIHEPALVARTCTPAKLLGCPKFVGTPRCNVERRSSMNWCAMAKSRRLSSVGGD
jgi:hypothetical protein